MSDSPTDERGGALGRAWRSFDGLATDTLWSAALDVLAVFTALASVILIIDVLPEEEYGAFAALYGLVTIFSAITYSGPGLALVQRRLRYNQDLDEILTSFLSLAVLAGLVSTALAIGLALLLNPLSLAEIVVVTASELFANSIIWVTSWLIQVAVDYPAMIRVRMTAVGLKLIAVPVLYFTGQLTIFNLGLAYLVLYGLFAFWLVTRRLPAAGYNLRFGQPPADAWRTSGAFAVPLAASQIQLDGDKVALTAFRLEADAGLYAAAYRVVMLGSLPVRVISQAAFHRFLAQGDETIDGYHLKRAVRLTGVLFVVGVAAAGVVYLLVRLFEPLIDLVLSDGYQEAKDIIPWLVLFIPLMALSGTPLNALLGLGRTRERAGVYLSSALVSVLLYVTLIPGRGWEGAVAATLASEAYLVVASWTAMIYYQRLADQQRRSNGSTPVGTTV